MSRAKAAAVAPAAAPAIYDGWARGIEPPTRLTVSQWADRHRMLPSVSSAEPGKWRNDRTPYATEIMDRLSTSDPVSMVVLQKASQIGGTEIGNNWLGYIIHHSPGPTAFVMPTEEDARLANEQRLEPLIDSTPELRALVTEARAKENSSRRFLKQFPGGLIRSVWANAPAKLKSMPAGNLFMDECDEYPADAGGQGDPVELALARCRTFSRSKAFLPSTPTKKGTSRIADLYRRGDQRRYFVPCPHCDEYQTLEWEGLKFERDDRGMPVDDSVHYECSACAEHITNSEKERMLARGEWRATVRGEQGITSYHLSALYSPVGWYSWADAARGFCAALRDMREKRNPAAMIAFRNTVLGLEWDEDDGASQTQWASVAARAEDYAAGIAPASVLMLTAGVDTQDDRLEVSVYGWGEAEEAWLVTHEVFAGDPGRPEVWDQLDEFLSSSWPTEDGRELTIVSTAIDSGGHHTHDVYNFVRPRFRRGVVAIKGANTAAAPMVAKPTLQDVNHRGVRIKAGVRLWPLGVHKIKEVLSRRLKISEPGPGRVHTYEGIHEGWYQQLCGEFLAKRHKGGKTAEVWTKTSPSQAVEAWDCFVYAYAAAIRVGMDRGLLDRLAARLARAPRKARRAAPVAAGETPPTHVPAPEPKPARQAQGPAVRTVTPGQKRSRKRATKSKWLGR